MTAPEIQSIFELYDEMEKKSLTLDLPDVKNTNEWRKFCSKINILSQEGTDTVLQFIYHHYLLENSYYTSPEDKKKLLLTQLSLINDSRRNISKQPYLVQSFSTTTGPGNGKGLMFNFDNIPDKLRRIIAAYVS